MLLLVYSTRRLYTARITFACYIGIDMVWPGYVFPNVISELKIFMLIVMTCGCTIMFMCIEGYDFDIKYDLIDMWLRFY